MGTSRRDAFCSGRTMLIVIPFLSGFTDIANAENRNKIVALNAKDIPNYLGIMFPFFSPKLRSHPAVYYIKGATRKTAMTKFEASRLSCRIHCRNFQAHPSARLCDGSSVARRLFYPSAARRTAMCRCILTCKQTSEPVLPHSVHAVETLFTAAYPTNRSEAQQSFVSAKPPPRRALSGTKLYLLICFAYQAYYFCRRFWVRRAVGVLWILYDRWERLSTAGALHGLGTSVKVHPVYGLMLIISPSRSDLPSDYTHRKPRMFAEKHLSLDGVTRSTADRHRYARLRSHSPSTAIFSPVPLLSHSWRVILLHEGTARDKTVSTDGHGSRTLRGSSNGISDLQGDAHPPPSGIFRRALFASASFPATHPACTVQLAVPSGAGKDGDGRDYGRSILQRIRTQEEATVVGRENHQRSSSDRRASTSRLGYSYLSFSL
jgi:hypothetical protein